MNGLFLALQLTTAAAAPHGAAMPLSLGHPCADPRYPTLAGPWVIGCGATGSVDRAQPLTFGSRVTLDQPMAAPGVAPGRLFAPSVGVASLPDGAITPARSFHRHRWSAATAPPAIAGEHVAITTEESLDVTDLGSPVIRRFGPSSGTPAPLGWYPPAIGGGYIAWVVDGQEDGADVWWVPVGQGRPEPLATGPGHHHHVVGHDRWLAWIAPDEVVVMDTETGARTRHPARTGFSAGLTLWRDVACWETRTDSDVDITCSDGVRIQGPGHQRWPSRWGDQLLYRDEGQLMLWSRWKPTAVARPASYP